jgi:hypothetical protein
MGYARILLAAVLLLGGCGQAARQTAVKPEATVDPQIGSLRAQLARARAERDDALARLRELQRRKPAVVRVVVREPAVAPAVHASDSGQPATQVFTTVSTSP